MNAWTKSHPGLLAISLMGGLLSFSLQAAPAGGADAAQAVSRQTPQVATILAKWTPYANELSADPRVWREQLAAVLSLATPATLARIAQIEPAADIQSRAGGYLKIFNMAVSDFAKRKATERQGEASGSRSEVSAKLGTSGSDLVFVPMPPCRVVDTRSVGGPISAGTARNFYFYVESVPSYSWSEQGGAAGAVIASCPKTAFSAIGGSLGNAAPDAALATITAVNTTAAGNWLVWGGVGAPPGATSSSLNWSAGDVLANTTIIPAGGRTGTGAGGTVLDFGVKYNGPSGSADLVVDVVGYFVRSSAAALDCVETSIATVGLDAGTSDSTSSPACGMGYTMTGGGCVLVEKSGWLVDSAL